MKENEALPRGLAELIRRILDPSGNQPGSAQEPANQLLRFAKSLYIRQASPGITQAMLAGQADRPPEKRG